MPIHRRNLWSGGTPETAENDVHAAIDTLSLDDVDVVLGVVAIKPFFITSYAGAAKLG
jgi:hypothetical protein